jgi:hypothetical protein
VHEFLTRWSSAEITELMAYELVEGPIGGRRGDHQAALIASTVANALGGRRRKFTDFLFQWGKRRRARNGHELLAAAKSINAALGGTTDGG